MASSTTDLQPFIQTAVPGLARLIEKPPAAPTEGDLPQCFERSKATPASRGLGEVGIGDQ